MRTIALAAAMAALSLPGVPARAEVRGLTCGYFSLTNPVDEEKQTAEVDGGPYLVADLDDLVANPVAVTLTCSLQIGEETTHTAPDLASVSVSGNVVVALPPTVVSFRDDGTYRLVVLCTELAITDAHGETHHLYWDQVDDEFSTSPDVLCWDWDDYDSGPYDPLWEVVDPLACLPLAVLFPPEGDVEGLWDCPPYATLRG